MKEILLKDYVVALTNLYGIVSKEKVVEIFNLHNDDKISLEDLKTISSKILEAGFVSIHKGYYVNDSILEFDEFDLMMEKKGDKPYYIPKQAELLRYADNFHFEKNDAYNKFLDYMKNHFFEDEDKAEWFCEDIYGICQHDFDIQMIFQMFNDRKISFKSEKQINGVLQLVMELSNNVRLWENNGFTPQEIFEKFEKPNLKPLPDKPFEFRSSAKVGRNDPCPCGSGKKYKKCCLGKEDV